MTKRQPQVINNCPTCELEFVGRYGAPCPQCPMLPTIEATRAEVENAQPFKVLTDTDAERFELHLNYAAADGWDLERVYTCQTRERDEEWPVLVALLRRRDYDPAYHSAAVTKHREAVSAHREMQKRAERDVEELKARPGDEIAPQDR